MRDHFATLDSLEPQEGLLTYLIMTRLGTFRATYLVALCCVGSFLFAYDTGIVGGVLTLQSFQNDFGFSAKEKSDVSSLSASLLQAGGE